MGDFIRLVTVLGILMGMAVGVLCVAWWVVHLV